MPDDINLVSTQPGISGPHGEFLSKLVNQLEYGRLYWKPLHDRQDYWTTLYLLLDPIQQSKPVGYRRFISNDPRTAIDTGISILTRNDSFWRIDMPPGINREERERIGKIEKALLGIVDDIDELFLTTGQPRLWKQSAWWALSRGWIWGKFHVTKEAIDFGRPTPLLPEMWDPRYVYPQFDGIGLESVICEKHTTFGEFMMQYPDVFKDVVQRSQYLDYNTPCIKVEYWSNNRPGRKGQYACAGYVQISQPTPGYTGLPQETTGSNFARWLCEPMEHDFTPEALPVVGVPVNGIPIKTKPLLTEGLINNINARMSRTGNGIPSWHDPSGWVAESGRGLLSSVEELIPQYNELIATVLQHFSIGTYGTWVFKTQSGELPEFEDGINAKVPLRIGESAERFEPTPINADAFRLHEIIRGERERGMLNQVLQASNIPNVTGVALNQALNTALNALEPYGSGLADFGAMMASHVLEQLRQAGLGPISLAARSGRSYWRIEFDPENDLMGRKYKPIPVFKPALPDDFLMRAQAARILLDPRRPVMSLVTVLDQVLKLDDPEGEIQRIFEDIANLDPVIVLERVADALEKAGELEIAERIRLNEFRQAFVQDMNFRQLQGQAQGGMDSQVAGTIPGMSPQSGSPLATGGGGGRFGQGQATGMESVTGGTGVY